MIDPEEHLFEDLQELADTIARAIIDEQAKIERLAAESGKRQERMLGLKADESDHFFLNVHFVCEPGQFATRTIEGDLADVAEHALGGR